MLHQPQETLFGEMNGNTLYLLIGPNQGTDVGSQVQR